MNRRSFFKGLAALAVIPNALMTKVAQAKVASAPLVFGRCLNVEPVLVAPVDLIFQINEGSVKYIEAVRDRGALLTIEGDEPTRAALRLCSIAPGRSRTCVAEGLIRLGACPDGPVTVDVVGEGLTPRVMRMDELAGIVRSGDQSREWRDRLEAQGLLVRTWGTGAT